MSALPYYIHLCCRKVVSPHLSPTKTLLSSSEYVRWPQKDNSANVEVERAGRMCVVYVSDIQKNSISAELMMTMLVSMYGGLCLVLFFIH